MLYWYIGSLLIQRLCDLHLNSRTVECIHVFSQYSMMLGELDAASGFLHKAIRLAHQSHNHDAIIYTYSLVVLLPDIPSSHYITHFL